MRHHAKGGMRIAALAAALALMCFAQASAQSLDTRIAPEDRTWVTLGSGEAKTFSAAEVASRYLGYAILAGRSYDRLRMDNPARPTVHENSAENESYWPKTFRKIGHRAFVLGGQRWTLAGGREGRQPCPQGDPDCRPVEGLGVHFWKRRNVRGGRCSEVVIAFRGTEGLFSGSMRSNLNPVAPVFIFFRIFGPGADHYYQVRTNIDNWVKELEKVPCVGAKTRFVTVGHSLGGGLATHAAYQNSRISKVYTFNTSPVTAWSSVNSQLRDTNVKGLEIDHVVEQGEMVAAVRFAPAMWWRPRACDPQERTIYFNASQSDPVSQHKIWPLAQRLYTWSDPRKVRKRKAVPLPEATLNDKITHRCITEPREEFLARVEAEGNARTALMPSAITVRPTPVRP
jgi:pimeloyl-ACP methyl ester carboxylesterase